MAINKMLKFVDISRDMPTKRVPNLRKKDYNEVYQEFAAEKAAEQSSRCSQCGVPFCQTHCPLHNNIPDWLRLTAEGRLKEAYELSQDTNTFPEICGRICPQDRLCEGNCVIEQSGHETVTIGSVEKYITDTAWEKGWVKVISPKIERKESVGIIGAGPAGLAAADRCGAFDAAVSHRNDRIYPDTIAYRLVWPRRGFGWMVQPRIRRIDRGSARVLDIGAADLGFQRGRPVGAGPIL